MVIMNRVLSFLILFLAIAACKPEPKELVITGEWELSNIAAKTKSVTIGHETVSVYVSFNSDNSFVLYQKLGEGFYRKFNGSWTLVEALLSGKYSDGNAWATDYQLSLSDDGNYLTMTPIKADSEELVYKKTSIPEKVKNDSMQ